MEVKTCGRTRGVELPSRRIEPFLLKNTSKQNGSFLTQAFVPKWRTKQLFARCCSQRLMRRVIGTNRSTNTVKSSNSGRLSPADSRLPAANVCPKEGRVTFDPCYCFTYGTHTLFGLSSLNNYRFNLCCTAALAHVWNTHVHTHTHTRTYVYIYTYGEAIESEQLLNCS